MSKTFTFTIKVTGAIELNQAGRDSITKIACDAAEKEMERLSQIAARNQVDVHVAEVTPDA